MAEKRHTTPPDVIVGATWYHSAVQTFAGVDICPPPELAATRCRSDVICESYMAGWNNTKEPSPWLFPKGELTERLAPLLPLTYIFTRAIIYLIKGVAVFSEAASPKLRQTALYRRSHYFLCSKHREIIPMITRQKLNSSNHVTIGITSLLGSD